MKIKILVIHGANEDNASYKKRFMEAYPELHKNHDIWDVNIVTFGNKVTGRNYEKIFFDRDSLSAKDIADYVLKMKACKEIRGISLSKKGRLSTTIAAPVKKFFTKDPE